MASHCRRGHPRSARTRGGFPDIERWVDGEIERGTNTQLGRWRWWSREGVLRHEEQRDPRGEAMLVARYRGDGTLEKKTQKDAHGEQRELFGVHGTLAVRTRSDARGRPIYVGTWHADGTLAEECTRVFEGDVLVGVVEKAERGARRFEARREGTALACVLYHDDGKTHAATGLVEGTLLGTWRLFDPGGSLRREIDTTTYAIAHEATGRGLAARLGEALFRHDEPELATPPQLAGLDQEPWPELSASRRTEPGRLPALVRGLVAADPLVREYALHAIRDEVLADGNVAPATARMVTYLARLLEHPAAETSRLLALLQELGEVALPRADVDGDEPVHATARALDASWPDIFAQFPRAPLEDRRRIFELAKLAPAAKPAILEIARRDSDGTLRACAVRCFCELPTFIAADAAPLLADKDPLVRATTAIALGLHRGPHAPRETVHGLDDAVRGWRDYARRYAELPFGGGHVLAQLALAAGAIGTPDARSLAQQLCAALDEVDDHSALAYVRGLLALAFGPAPEPRPIAHPPVAVAGAAPAGTAPAARPDGGTAPFARPYAKRFVEILDTIARSRTFWTHETAACEVLARWRLPQGRIALINLVGELRASSEPEATMHGKLTAAPAATTS